MGYARLDGVRFWYETHGTGRPLVLLHGGFGAVETFAAIRPALARRRLVVSVDLPGHGRTPDTGRPLRYESMADEVAALIVHLGLAEAEVLGFSLGGGVALRMAVQHRQLLRRLVVVSAPCRRQGWFPEVLAGMPEPDEAAAERMRGTPPEQLYRRVAPRPQDWPLLWTRTGELLRRDYDWSSEVASITTPTMLVFADADSVRPAHMVEFFGLLGGGIGTPGGTAPTDRPPGWRPAWTHPLRRRRLTRPAHGGPPLPHPRLHPAHLTPPPHRPQTVAVAGPPGAGGNNIGDVAESSSVGGSSFGDVAGSPSGRRQQYRRYCCLDDRARCPAGRAASRRGPVDHCDAAGPVDEQVVRAEIHVAQGVAGQRRGASVEVRDVRPGRRSAG